MSEGLSREEIQEIEARCKAATPGPWEDTFYDAEWYVTGPEYTDVSFNESDTIFIAHSREDVPALVAEVKRQGTALETVREKLREAALALRGALTAEAEQNVLEALEAAGGEAPEQTPITEAIAALQDSPAGEAWDAVEYPDDYLLRERFGDEGED
jgi:hypothetical protein